MKNPESIKKKINSYSHQEYNKERFTNIDSIKKKIALHQDLFERKIIYKKIDLNDNFPDYILKNKELFKDWIL